MQLRAVGGGAGHGPSNMVFIAFLSSWPLPPEAAPAGPGGMPGKIDYRSVGAHLDLMDRLSVFRRNRTHSGQLLAGA